ncbi:hypothetical protein QC761_0103780 [Podospora bellae-mahoneyi]|uniref:Uncharacterized protein n=1 Tax=Podospora bellae-mahoneyi TaxID=2093777 RepID=A0ABR0F6U1_9PEZI|nr:hypothetical protein QC761_0103780 [Podospora bellae-mahoneyi]
MMWRLMRVFLVGGLLANWTWDTDNYIQLYHTNEAWGADRYHSLFRRARTPLFGILSVSSPPVNACICHSG